MATNKLIDEGRLSHFKTKLDLLFANKVDKEAGKGLSTNDYTDAEKTKLAGIEAQANKTVVDSTLSTSSSNPVQNSTITTALNSKVDSVNGKGLSTEDYTTNEKTKLGGISAGAQVNTIETIKVNGQAQTITNKAVDITVPDSTSDLTNDSDFQNGTQVGTAISTALEDYTNTTNMNTAISNATSGKLDTSTFNTTIANYSTTSEMNTAIATAVGAIQGIRYELVATLPATGQNGVIYLVPNSGSNPNSKDEYIWLETDNRFEKIGTTDVDLSGYVQTTDIIYATDAEIDAMFA